MNEQLSIMNDWTLLDNIVYKTNNTHTRNRSPGCAERPAGITSFILHLILLLKSLVCLDPEYNPNLPATKRTL